jgi:hypothetical protein
MVNRKHIRKEELTKLNNLFSIKRTKIGGQQLNDFWQLLAVECLATSQKNFDVYVSLSKTMKFERHLSY